MRADRLLSLVLLLHARGRATAQAIAAELETDDRRGQGTVGAT